MVMGIHLRVTGHEEMFLLNLKTRVISFLDGRACIQLSEKAFNDIMFKLIVTEEYEMDILL